uniref:Putative secreted protein n=1 Tax=Anopheles darlingi TaxID=43151 RepID=A0A2M4D4N7_ANODA
MWSPPFFSLAGGCITFNFIFMITFYVHRARAPLSWSLLVHGEFFINFAEPAAAAEKCGDFFFLGKG